MGTKNVLLLHNPLIDEIFTQKKSYTRKKQILIGAKTSKILAYYLKKSNPDFQIIRLKKLPIEKVYDLMSESYIYADFTISNRDRAPREAAFLDCIVFTSNKGSAGYIQDLPIPDYYKMEGKLTNYIKINLRIKSAIKNYEAFKTDFIEYKMQSIKEKEGFNEMVGSLFQKIEEKYLRQNQ
jgi:hypothetical protein